VGRDMSRQLQDDLISFPALRKEVIAYPIIETRRESYMIPYKGGQNSLIKAKDRDAGLDKMLLLQPLNGQVPVRLDPWLER
jgi:hypothetical protein